MCWFSWLGWIFAAFFMVLCVWEHEEKRKVERVKLKELLEELWPGK